MKASETTLFNNKFPLLKLPSKTSKRPTPKTSHFFALNSTASLIPSPPYQSNPNNIPCCHHHNPMRNYHNLLQKDQITRKISQPANSNISTAPYLSHQTHNNLMSPTHNHSLTSLLRTSTRNSISLNHHPNSELTHSGAAVAFSYKVNYNALKCIHTNSESQETVNNMNTWEIRQRKQ